MAKNISTQDLVNELEDAVASSRKFLKSLEDSAKVLKDMAVILKESSGAFDKNSSKGLADFNKALTVANTLLEKNEQINEDRKKTNSDVAKQEKQLVDLRKKLAAALSDEVTENEKLKLQIQEQNKVRKQQLKQSLGLLDAYQQESARLNTLRKRWKNLAAQNKENTKEGKELLDNITQLDEKLKEIDKTVGQNQRSVGDYQQAIKGLNSTINKLGIGLAISKGVQLLTGAFGDSRDGALLLEQAMNRLTATISVVIGRIVGAVKQMKALFDGATDAFDVLKAGGKSLSILFGAFDNLVDSIGETIDNLDTVTKLTQKYDIEIQALERSISKLNKAQTLQLQISENDTLSFDIRRAASEQAVEQAIELGNLETRLAAKRLDQQVKTIATQLNAKDVAIDVQNATASQIITLLKATDAEGKFTNAKKISAETERAFTDAFVDNQQTQLEAGERLADTLEKQNKLFSDRAEIILDIQIDALDNQKSINERIVASDKATFEVRENLLNRTKKLFADGFEAQKETLIDFNNQIIASEKVKIESNKLLTDSQKKTQLAELDRQKAVLTGAKIDEIVAEDNAVIQAKKILLLGLNEKAIIRLLSAVRDFRTGEQDLKESTEALNESLAEQIDLEREIAIQQEALISSNKKEGFKKFEQDILDEEIKAARRRLRLAEEEALKSSEGKSKQSKATLEAQRDLNDLLIDEQKRFIDKAEEADKKAEADKEKRDKENAQKRKELINETINFIENALQKSSEKQIAQIDKELATNQARIQQINAAIAAGNQEANASLAVEEKRTRELEREKEQQRKKAQRAEAAIAILRAFGENSDQPNALGKTISDTTALLAFINTLPTAFEGTESTGTVNDPLDSNGGRLMMLHDNERVMTAKQNAKIGSISNEELSDLGHMYNKGVFNPNMLASRHSNHELISEVREMTKAVRSIPTPSYNYDANGRYHEQVLQSRNKIERIKIKAKNIYS